MRFGHKGRNFYWIYVAIDTVVRVSEGYEKKHVSRVAD